MLLCQKDDIRTQDKMGTGQSSFRHERLFEHLLDQGYNRELIDTVIESFYNKPPIDNEIQSTNALEILAEAFAQSVECKFTSLSLIVIKMKK